MSQMTLFQMMYETYKIRKPVRLIETFSGYGSQAMALERLGVDFEHYRSYEIDEFAVKSYNAVHGTDFEPADICAVHAGDLGITEKDKYAYVLTWSFPCTDLSLAGKQMGMAEGSGTRSSLLWEIKRILGECRETGQLPDVLLMENVTAIHSQDNKIHFQAMLDFLQSLGYSNYCQDLNAADYGVAQNRDRTFVVSILGEYNYDFPTPIELNTCIEDYFEDMTEKEALKLIVKSPKAMELLVELNEKGELK